MWTDQQIAYLWSRLDRIDQALAAVQTILKLERKTMDKLTADVAALTSVKDSVIALLQGLKSQLDAAIAANDPTKLTALSAAIEANTQALSAAVTANTPAAPAP